MAKYKAKESYKKLTPEENYCAYGSSSSHMVLMDGGVIEKDVPNKLLEHLTEVKSKTVKEKGDK